MEKSAINLNICSDYSLCTFFPLPFSEISLELCKFLSAGGGGGIHAVPSSGLSLKLLQEATKFMNLERMS